MKRGAGAGFIFGWVQKGYSRMLLVQAQFLSACRPLFGRVSVRGYAATTGLCRYWPAQDIIVVREIARAPRAHFLQHGFAGRREIGAFVAAIDGVGLAPDDAAGFQACQHAGSRGAIDADFLCKRDLIHAGLRHQHLHHAGLHRCGAEALAVLEIDGDIDLMQPPHQEAGSSEQGNSRRLSALTFLHLCCPIQFRSSSGI
jgi:hypothetical protein